MQNSAPIDIEALIKSKNPGLLRWIPAFVLRYLKAKLHQDEINSFLAEYGHLKNQAFCEAIMRYFEFSIQIEGIENIPKEGGVILALNHPLGGMDGVALIHALRQHRQDVALIVNDLLLNISQLRDLFVGVNKFGRNQGSVRGNIREAFEKEQVLIIFPAGMVTRIHNGQIVEPDWKKTFISYARELNRPVVPIYIVGKLSNAFYRLNRLRSAVGIKANLEMFLLADEMYKQKKGTIRFIVGKPQMGAEIQPDLDDSAAANWFRNQVYALKPKS
jgi:putative hemolysin